jgi:hypothetical protein
VIEEDSKEESE